MLDAANFGSTTAAHLVYARGLPFAAAMDAVEERRRDRGWRAAPEAWAETLNTVIHKAKAAAEVERVRAFLRELAADLAKQDRPDALTTSIPHVLRWLAAQVACGEDLHRFVQATLTAALPGDAGTLATALGQAGNACGGSAAWPPALLDLTEWLLRNGGAELRRGDRAFLLQEIALQGDRARCVWVPLAFQYGLRDETFPNFWTDQVERRLWDVVEKHTEPASEYLALDPVRLAGSRMYPAPRPLIGLDHPRCRDAILGALLRGDLPRPTMERIWSFLVAGSIPLPPDAQVTNGEALESVRPALHGALAGPPGNPHWIAFITSEILRIYSSPRLTRHAIGRELLAFARHTHLAPGMLMGLQRYLGAQPADDLTLVRAVIEDDSSASQATRVSTCMQVLADRTPSRPKEDVTAETERLRSDLGRVLGHPWGRPVYGTDFAGLLGDAQTVELVELSGEDKVQLEGGIWRLDRQSIENCARVAHRRDYERGLRLAILFAIHETLHLRQGIGAKEAVDRLRSTGAEHTLLQIDLAADHGAALLACQVFPQWNLAELKGLLGEEGFPSSPRHTMAARSRKALRRISLRLDSLLRRARPDLAARLGAGYAWADFGPAGGWFLILSSGPPASLVATAKLSGEQAELLGGAAGRAAMTTEGLLALDRCVERLVSDCTAP